MQISKNSIFLFNNRVVTNANDQKHEIKNQNEKNKNEQEEPEDSEEQNPKIL